MRIVKIIIPCLLLGACVFGKSQNAKFYTQFAVATNAVAADYTDSIGINRIQLPKYVERPQIVTQVKDSAQMNISEYNRWVEFPSVLATRAVTEDLSSLLPAAQVKMNSLKGEKFDKTITIEISRMNAVLGEKAEIVAWYTLKDNSGKVLAHQKFTDMVLIGKTYDDLAQGYSQLLAHLSRTLADVLLQNK